MRLSACALLDLSSLTPGEARTAANGEGGGKELELPRGLGLAPELDRLMGAAWREITVLMRVLFRVLLDLTKLSGPGCSRSPEMFPLGLQQHSERACGLSRSTLRLTLADLLGGGARFSLGTLVFVGMTGGT
eukprot:CAMPEP_0175116358 /NCGR_PEP_ID=MMETSP0086_2-20121207/18133_1 /TAXON_ID=136419 /ORGANISM="Unknown Unknown, Strain D1" /LENGTH=131 /DNA_ID=CAMNT_0016396641 /DNA_START=49 /DNA_END=441 /DNA_ORIENTATION=+